MSATPADVARERMLLCAVAAGSLVAGAGLYWAVKQTVDYYVPYRVRRLLCSMIVGAAASVVMCDGQPASTQTLRVVRARRSLH